MDGLYNETLSEMTCSVTSSRGTIEIFTRMLFVRNKTLSMLGIVVKNPQGSKNMKELSKRKFTSRRQFFSSSTLVASSLPELFLTDSYRISPDISVE